MSDIITTLHPENDENVNLYPNIKKENIPNGVVDTSKLSPDVNNILNGINDILAAAIASITQPKYYNISSLPTTDVGLVVGSDGYIYSWNGSQYVTTGIVYQATQLSDEDLDLFVKSFSEATLTANSFVRYSDGDIRTLNNVNVIEIDVTNISKLKYNYTVTNLDARGLAFFDSTGTFISGVQTNTAVQIIDVPANAVTCKATVKTNKQLCYIINIIDVINNGKTNTNDITTLIKNYSTESEYFHEGEYVNYINGNTGSFSSANYIELCVYGISKIYYNYTFFNPDLRGVAFYDKYNNFISGVQVATTTQIINVPANAVTCKATVKEAKDVLLHIDSNHINKAIYDNVKENLNILYAYNNITCIGDSLTHSQVFTSATTSRQAYQTYPMCLGRLTGANVVGLAKNGASAISWWNDFNEDLESKTNQLAIIYLGTNGGLTDTLSTDAPVNTPYTEWAETNTGVYAKIVARCQELGMKVAVLEVFGTSGDMGVDVTNDVINQIATRFGCAVIKKLRLTDAKYHYYPDGTGQNTVHYNDLGYSAFASALANEFSILNNDNMKMIIPE